MPKSKVCKVCKRRKLLDAFYGHPQTLDGLDSRCKKCHCRRTTDRYKKDPAFRERMLKRNREAKQRNCRRLLRYLAKHPCVDCGESDVVVLECDHVGGKDASIFYLVAHSSWKTVKAELRKCEVRCANCHKSRTAKQQGWYKAIKYDNQPYSGRRRLLRLLKKSKCVDCSENDPVVLEFDHVRGTKVANVSVLAHFIWKMVQREIKKCDIVCANCHKRRTAKSQGWYRHHFTKAA